jgi:NAD(P)-dependent dehydrogenase (short-subunit alcohol dehydrogenase family)
VIQGKVALVTGGTRGIGAAVVQAFAGAGASVVLTGKSEPTELVDPPGGGSVWRQCDIADEDSVDRLFEFIQAAYGGVDIVVNNAGINDNAAGHKMSRDQFVGVLDVNLVGTWMCCRAALNQMRAHGRGGSILNISSVSATAANIGQVNYAASKAGVEAMTKVLARESARHNIRVNAVRPGLIATDMTSTMDERTRARMMESIPLGRPGTPEEVAQAALFLASNMSSYVTGAVIDVSGGRWM